MKIVRITKRFTRKVSHDYKSWEFSTELTADVDIDNDEDLKAASSQLFVKAHNCVVADMKKTFKLGDTGPTDLKEHDGN